MKKDRLLLIAVLFISIIASHCSKGPMGPQGTQGPPGTNGSNGTPGAQGPKGDSGADGSNGADGTDGVNGADGTDGAPGAQGPAGTANVIYSSWIDGNILDVNWHDSVLTSGTLSVVYVSAPDITQNIIDSGVVLCYVKGEGLIAPTMLPYLTDDYILGFAPAPSTLILYIDDTRHHDAHLAKPTPDWQYRYVIIPGGVPASGRRIDPRSMTYQQLCKTYNIPQ